jgi:anti-sigma regulatory factor (Ser/Thr protein kinase)
MNSRTAAHGGLDITCMAATTVAAEVRQRIGIRLAEWGLSGVVDDACLVAGELVVNACEATPDGAIRIRFTRESRTVTFAVWDASDRMPQVRRVIELEPEDLDLSPENWDNNGGWGLSLVQALSSECGVSRTAPRGKWVWARLTTDSAA